MTLIGHIVSHTHWDREWYLPFQPFRLKLVDLIDELLDILAQDSAYRHFMLDGQAVLLEDYLAVRPEREEELRRHSQAGRLLIGPWYILPDEFLVSGEATIRNLLLGRRVCRRFGPWLNVGYVPDPFGHISQLPQILAGFGIDTAVFRRGLADEPALLRWASPDGTEVFVVYLRDGYDNAAWLPADPQGFTDALRERVERLAPHTPSRHILLMNGTDHMRPIRELPALMAYANDHLDNIELVHSTLPEYVQRARDPEPASLNPDLPTANPPSPGRLIQGELRSPKRHHLLPGVLSARMWIKQRNHALEVLLERWAEPFSAWAWLLGGPDRSAQVWQAWRYLLQNQPHDSICGCSVDQVHREMVTRFDWAGQIAETVAAESLTAIAGQVDTTAFGAGVPIVVFNPTAGPRTDLVTIEVPLPAGRGPWTVVDSAGRPVPTQLVEKPGTVILQLTLNPTTLRAMLPMVSDGRIREWAVHDLDVQVDGTTAFLDLKVARNAPPTTARLAEGRQRIQELLDSGVSRFDVRVHTGTLAGTQFVASDVPGHGYRTFALRRAATAPALSEAHGAPGGDSQSEDRAGLENEFFQVRVDGGDGTITVLDTRTGAVFAGLNRFVDGGDGGDEYNYCPPAEDLVVDGPAQPPEVTFVNGPASQTVQITLTCRLPAGLAANRRTRSPQMIDVPITTAISLTPGVPRIDVRTTIDNRATDHRLRVLFPTAVRTNHSTAESQFDVITRPIDLPEDTADWVEQPVATQPQRSFVDVSDGQGGLMVANRGLPEYEVVRSASGNTIALTLIRSVGWLSRDDFPCRKGHAGPFLETPAAQCPGEHTFEYSLIPHAGDRQVASAQAHAFSAPLRAAMTDIRPGALPLSDSLIQVEPASFVVTAVKRGEAGDGLIVRGFNSGPEPVVARVRLRGQTQSAMRANLAEEPVEALPLDDGGWVCLPVRSREIATLKFSRQAGDNQP